MNKYIDESEDEELDQFQTSPIMNELAKQQAPVSDIPDQDQMLEKEMSNAEEIANESMDLADRNPVMDVSPTMQKKAEYENMLAQFSKLKPKEQSNVQEDLKALQEQASKKSNTLNYFKIADKLAQAYGNRHGGKTISMSDVYDDLNKQAQQPIQDYDFQQKDKLNQLKLQLENEQIDPNSPLAKQQKLIVDQLAKDAGIELPDSGPMSAKAQEQQMRSLAYILGNKRQAEQARENALQRYKDTQLKLEEMRESRKEKQDIQKENELNKKVEKISKRAESQELIGKNNSLDTINNYLSSKFGVTLDSKDKDLGKVDIAGMGFLGQARPDFLTPKEDISFRQNVQSLANMLLKSRSGAAVTDQEYNRFLKEVGSGNFSSEANLLSGLKKMQKDIQDQNKNIGKIYGEEVLNEYQDRTGIKLNTADKVKVISPDGKPGFIPKENLDKALKKGFKKAE